MNKILKILSILVIGFVMFSCSTPTNDPETPVETPTDKTPEVQTYSITFVDSNQTFYDEPIADELNKNPDFKNIEANLEVILPEWVYVEEWGLEAKVKYTYESKVITSIIMDSDKSIAVQYMDDREVL